MAGSAASWRRRIPWTEALMPNNLTDYGENQLLVWQLTTTAITRPTAWYLGVGTGNTDITLTGEPSGNGYARQAVSFTVTADTATNSGAITFGPNTTSAWGTMASVAITLRMPAAPCTRNSCS